MKKLESEVVAEFTDRYGDDRQVIRRRSGRHLAVKRQRDSTCHAMMRVIGIHIGKRIREERQKKGMTAADLCRKAGLLAVSPKQRMLWKSRGFRRQPNCVVKNSAFGCAMCCGQQPKSACGTTAKKYHFSTPMQIVAHSNKRGPS